MISIAGFQEMVNIAKRNAKRHPVNLTEVSPKIAEQISKYKSTNKENFAQGVNKVVKEAKDVTLPSAETLRAYHGIDTPIPHRMTPKSK